MKTFPFLLLIGTLLTGCCRCDDRQHDHEDEGQASTKTVRALPQTPLAKSADDGDMYKVLDLVKNGVTVNTENEEGNTALHLAAMHGLEGMCMVLVRGGANRNLLNKEGKTAYALAIAGGHPLAAAACDPAAKTLNIPSELVEFERNQAKRGWEWWDDSWIIR